MTITVTELEKICELEPAHEFIKRRIEQNIKENLIECSGLRQTGRTTRMLLRAIEACSSGKNITIYTFNNRTKDIFLEKIEKILDKVQHIGYKIKDKTIFIGQNQISFKVKESNVLFDDSINECW